MSKKKENELKVVNICLVKESSIYSTDPITTPDDVLKVIAKELSTYGREVFAILVINLNICNVGTLNVAMISPREVFKSSILSNATAFIAIHNHPSGFPTSSEEDRTVTKRFEECGRMIDIKMLNHIIVAVESGQMMSFKSEGFMPQIDRTQGWER